MKLGEAPLVGRPDHDVRRLVRGRAHLSRARPGGGRTWPGLISAPPPRGACPRSASSRRRSSACSRPSTTASATGVRIVPVDRDRAQPASSRASRSTRTTLDELAASIREHGVLQPILVRPLDDGQFQLIAGERRWRASQDRRAAPTIPALVEEIDDDTALEISIIENLQREDLSPLDEAAMYDRMVREHGYSRPPARPEAGQGQGLPREPAPPRRRARPRSASSCPCARTPCRTPTS